MTARRLGLSCFFFYISFVTKWNNTLQLYSLGNSFRESGVQFKTFYFPSQATLHCSVKWLLSEAKLTITTKMAMVTINRKCSLGSVRGFLGV